MVVECGRAPQRQLRSGASAKQVAMAGDRTGQRAHVDDVAIDVDDDCDGSDRA